jgi:membrane fusion protein, multidrug efflux system
MPRLPIFAIFAGLMLAAASAHAQAPRLEARGVLQPEREATVSAEIAGRLVELKWGPGERFREGETLARIDCRFYDARLAQGVAARDVAKLQLDSDRELSQLRTIGQLDVLKSEANLRAADAEVALRRLDVARCVVPAPFAGRVVERRANAHESINAGMPLLDIVDDRSLRVRVIVPAGWLVWLKPGQTFRFAIDETGEKRAARVRDLGARIDPVSQTVGIIATIERPAEGLLAGMSGTAQFEAPAATRPGG